MKLLKNVERVFFQWNYRTHALKFIVATLICSLMARQLQLLPDKLPPCVFRVSPNFQRRHKKKNNNKFFFVHRDQRKIFVLLRRESRTGIIKHYTGQAKKKKERKLVVLFINSVVYVASFRARRATLDTVPEGVKNDAGKMFTRNLHLSNGVFGEVGRRGGGERDLYGEIVMGGAAPVYPALVVFFIVSLAT